MKIAIYTNAYKPIINGVVNTITLLKEGLNAQGHEVIIFAPDYYGYRDQEEGVYRFTSVDLTRKVRFPVAIPWCPRLNRVLRNFGPDIVHAHHPFVLGPIALRMARHLKVPLVITFHTQYEQYAHYIPVFRGDFIQRLTRNRIRWFVASADLVTTPAETIRELLRSYGVKKEIIMLPNPISLSGFNYQEGGTVRRQWGLSAEDLVLISVGRLGIEKNLGFMLEAFAVITSLVAEMPVRLVLVGDGPEEARLREMGAKLGLGDRVIFAGSVPYAAIPSYLAAADLFLMSSIAEVKPLVLLEAMGAGLPIVAVKASGAVDTVIHGNEGLLTELDKHEYANAVVDLLRDKERRMAMSRRAKETVGRYALDKVTAQLAALYEVLIDAKLHAIEQS